MDTYHIKSSELKANRNLISVSLYSILRRLTHKFVIQNRLN